MTLNIDPRKLLYFASIVEHGSFKKAAKVLGLSQPALSMSMDRLEAELHVQVLVRGPAGVTPTKLGDILYCRAQMIRSEIDLAEREMQSAILSDPDTIRFGTLPSLASGIVPAALNLWREQYPNQGLQVTECPQIDLLTGILRRELDFVIGYTECYDLEEGLRQRVLFRDSLLVIARAGHPLAQATGLTWEDIVSFPWICPTARRTHSVLEAALRIAKVAPPQKTTTGGSVSLQKSILTGSDYLCMLPAHAVRTELLEGRLISLPIQDPILNRQIAVFFREGFALNAASLALIDVIQTVGQKMCREAQSSLQMLAQLCPTA